MAHDIVIVGAGHNALTAAFYLAKGGRKPLVLERRHVVGGCATSEEFAPGYKAATLAHTIGPLRPSIVSDMQLERRGVRFVRPDPRVVALSSDGRALVISSDMARTMDAIPGVLRRAGAYRRLPRGTDRHDAAVHRCTIEE
jgi:phytoene dehydrogenase-like protein